MSARTYYIHDIYLANSIIFIGRGTCMYALTIIIMHDVYTIIDDITTAIHEDIN